MIPDPPFDREETIAILSGRNRRLLAERDALAAKLAEAREWMMKIGSIHGFSSAPDGWPSDWPKEKAP